MYIKSSLTERSSETAADSFFHLCYYPGPKDLLAAAGCPFVTANSELVPTVLEILESYLSVIATAVAMESNASTMILPKLASGPGLRTGGPLSPMFFVDFWALGWSRDGVTREIE
jgi:hypothetical protein